MEEQYHIARDGKQEGPYPRSTIQGWLISGQLDKATLCWTPGMQAWEPAGIRLGLVQPPPPPEEAAAGLAITSLVCGILGFCFGIFSAVPAVICGHLALAKAKKAGSSRGMATAGLVLGYVVLALGLVWLLFFIPMIGKITKDFSSSISNNSRAYDTKNELRMIDSAVDQYAIEYNLSAGSTVDWTQLQMYFGRGHRLSGSRTTVLGNSYQETYQVNELPMVPRAEYEAMSDVAPLEFWSPYPIAP